MVRLLVVALVALSMTLPAGAAMAPGEMLDDPALEARARALSAELRCLVCQNQSIDDSDAPLARDLRLLVRERLTAGDSDAEVLDFVVARYGEFVLMRPRFAPHTYLLWLAPLLLFAIGVAVAARAHRRRRAHQPPAATLSAAEKRRLEELTEGG